MAKRSIVKEDYKKACYLCVKAKNSNNQKDAWELVDYMYDQLIYKDMYDMFDKAEKWDKAVEKMKEVLKNEN